MPDDETPVTAREALAARIEAKLDRQQDQLRASINRLVDKHEKTDSRIEGLRVREAGRSGQADAIEALEKANAELRREVDRLWRWVIAALGTGVGLGGAPEGLRLLAAINGGG